MWTSPQDLKKGQCPPKGNWEDGAGPKTGTAPERQILMFPIPTLPIPASSYRLNLEATILKEMPIWLLLMGLKRVKYALPSYTCDSPGCPEPLHACITHRCVRDFSPRKVNLDSERMSLFSMNLPGQTEPWVTPVRPVPLGTHSPREPECLPTPSWMVQNAQRLQGTGSLPAAQGLDCHTRGLTPQGLQEALRTH